MIRLIISLAALATLCQSATLELTEAQIGPRVYYPGVCDASNCRYGTCEIYNATSFRCHCAKGVTGPKCDELDKTNNPCASNPCFGDSVCLNVNGQFTCVCTVGRVGITCEAHVAPCKCQNNGACVQVTTGAFTCTCPTNFGGNLCQYSLVNFNSCQTRPCQNFGFCTPQGICVCPGGCTGAFCETCPPTTATTTTTRATVTTQGDYCRTVTCQNFGICISISATQGFCNCQAGFFGPLCEFFVPPTTTTTSATTTTTAASTTTPPTTAVLCTANIASVCKNNGICYVINNANIFCLCASGFSGTVCEIPLTTTTISTTTPTTTTTTTTTTTATTTTTTTATTTTTTQPTTAITVAKCPTGVEICLNGGTCGITASGTISCSCPPDFEGVRCEDEKAFCDDPNPCENGGICLPFDETDGVCFCQGQYTGLYCESIGCNPNPCQNDHECFVSPSTGRARCICRTGYSGDYCEKKTA